MSIDSHLFLDTLEQVKELLSSPAVAYRAKEASLTGVILEFCELTDQYAVLQSTDARQPEDNEALTSILKELASKIEVVENHNLLSLKRLDFLSDVSPKT